MIFIEPVIAELRPGPEWIVDRGCILSLFLRPAGKPDSTFFAKLEFFCQSHSFKYYIIDDLVHESKIVDFGYSVVKMFPGDPLSRQLKDAVLIVNHCGPSMDDQREFVRPASVRLRAERSLGKPECGEKIF